MNKSYIIDYNGPGTNPEFIKAIQEVKDELRKYEYPFEDVKIKCKTVDNKVIVTLYVDDFKSYNEGELDELVKSFFEEEFIDQPDAWDNKFNEITIQSYVLQENNMKIKSFEDWMNEESTDEAIMLELKILASAYCGLMDDLFLEMKNNNEISFRPMFEYITSILDKTTLIIKVRGIPNSETNFNKYINKNMARTASYETSIGNKHKLNIEFTEPQRIKDYILYNMKIYY